jgi:uncharacterized membrane protein YoaK (UPF0700 family)
VELKSTLILSLLTCIFGCIIAAALGRYFRKEDPMRLAKALIFTVFLSWMVWVGGGGHGIGVVPLPSVVSFAFASQWADPTQYSGNYSSDHVANQISENRILMAASGLCSLFVFASYWLFSLPVKQEKRRL